MTGITPPGVVHVPHSAGVRFAVRLLVSGVLVAVLAVVIAIVLPLMSDGDSIVSRARVVCFALGMSALVAIGGVRLRRQMSDRMGWWLVAAGLAGLGSRLLAGALAALGSGNADVPDAVLWLVNWCWVPAQFAFFEVLLRFPTGRLGGRGWWLVEVFGIVWATLSVAVLALLPGPLTAEPLAHVQNPFGLASASGLLGALLGPVFIGAAALLVAGGASLVWRWVHSGRGTRERQQVRWVLAVGGLVALIIPAAWLGGVPELVEAFAWLALPAAIALAVRRPAS